MPLSLIAAIADNGVIGQSGKLPWYLPNDLKRFRQLTTGHTVVMGRPTLDSIGLPLPNRRNIVLTRQTNPLAGSPMNAVHIQGCEIVSSREALLELLPPAEEAFVIGGSTIFSILLPDVTRLYLTRVHATVDGDAYFPAIQTEDWQLISEEKHPQDPRHDHPFTFQVFDRLAPPGFVNERYARSPEYAATIRQIIAAGHCPFCPDSFLYHPHPVLKENGGWFITKTSQPYPNTSAHLLIIGREHKTEFSQLSSRDLTAVKNLVTWACDKFNIPGGSLHLRFGDTRWTGATVRHLHFHLISPAPGQTVSFPVG